MSRALVVCLLSALSVAACGGKVNDPAATTGDSGVPSDAVAADDGGSTTDTPLPDAMTCKALGDAICGAEAKGCCEQQSLAWDESACRTSVNYWCNYQVDAANAGSTLYDPTQLAACAKGWRDNFAACSVGWIFYAKTSLACAQMFNGTRAPGQACTSEVECKGEPGFIAYCDERDTADTSDDRCRQYGFVGEGQPCNYTGTTIRYCEEGLYCDYGVSPAACRKAKALGDACPGGQDPSCGYDHVCVDGKCAPGKAGGSDCTESTECASWSCEAGKCTETKFPVATSQTCNGTSSTDAGSGGTDAGSGGTDAGMAGET